MTLLKWFLFLTCLIISPKVFGVNRYAVTLKPSVSGEKILVSPAQFDNTPLPNDINRALLKLLSDNKFLPFSKDEIMSSNTGDSISFGYPFSFSKKASERFRGCIVSWFENLDSVEAINFGAYVYATLDSQPENEWKNYGTKMADNFLQATENGSTDCLEKSPTKDDAEGILIQIDSYLSKSGAQPKAIKSRISWFGDRIISTMRDNIFQKRSSELLTYIRQWIENIRSTSLDSSMLIDLQELWDGKKLSRSELAGRTIFGLISKENVNIASETKDVKHIYGALLSVDNLLTACFDSKDQTSSSLCIETGKIFWLDLKTANGNALFILSK